MTIYDNREPLLGFDEAFERVSTAPYPSRTRIGLYLARAAAAAAAGAPGGLTSEQIRKLHDTALARRQELKAVGRNAPAGVAEPAGASAVVATAEQPVAADDDSWSPSAIFDTLPPGERPADYRERQMSVGDREDHLNYE